MKLKELKLIGFGKFNNKSIELAEGINIIYGENEAGKTTLHNFINGMFYGFLRPNIERVLYLEEYDKYNPWSNDRYSGLIRFEYRGEDFVIERDFTKGEEKTLVYLAATGDDITHSIEAGGRRVLQPGYHFFGFSDSVYSNTISIKQLGCKTEDSLANEVRDKLVNISTSLDDSVSVEKAVEELDKALKDIGSPKAPTRPYGKACSELERLKEEKKEVLENKEAYKVTLRQLTSLKEKWEEEKERLKELKKRYENAQLLERYKIYRDIQKLKEEIKTLEGRLELYEDYKAISSDQYERALELAYSIESKEKEEKELKLDLGLVEDNIKELGNSQFEEVELYKDLELDYENYEQLEEEKNKFLFINTEDEKRVLKRDYENGEEGIKNYKNLLIASLLVFLGTSMFGLKSSNYLLLGISLIALLGSGFSLARVRNLERLNQEIRVELRQLEAEDRKVEQEKKEIEAIQNTILRKYKVASKLELKRLYNSMTLSSIKLEDRRERLEENKKRKLKLLERLKKLDEERQSHIKLLNNLLEENKAQDIEEFRENLNKKDSYEKTINKLENKRVLLKQALGQYKWEELKEQLIDQEEIEKIEEDLTSSRLNQMIGEKQERIYQLEVENSKLEERLKTLNSKLERLVEIDEEIERKKKLIEDLDNKREAIKMAKETIESLSKDIHKQFAPSINKKIGKIIGNITGGKYTSVMIDDQLEISVENPKTKKIVKVDDLSGGTIDQLYFALRFGIIDSIEEEAPPLILDDCFIQYDDNRLANIMDFLADVSQNRQVILFTCHKREANFLEDRQVDFNLIKL